MVVTPDGATLVVSESFAGRLSAFDIGEDGSLTGRRVWADGLGPDGIGVDAEGAVWARTADTFAHSGRPDAPGGACVRVLDGGGITHRIDTELPLLLVRPGRTRGPAPVPALQRVRGHRQARRGPGPAVVPHPRHRGAGDQPRRA